MKRKAKGSSAAAWFAGRSFHQHTALAVVPPAEAMIELDDAIAQADCQICDVWGKACCTLHRHFVSAVVKDIPDEGAPAIRFDRGGGDR